MPFLAPVAEGLAAKEDFIAHVVCHSNLKCHSCRLTSIMAAQLMGCADSALFVASWALEAVMEFDWAIDLGLSDFH